MDLYNNADLLQMILAALGSNRGGPNLEISGDPGAQAQSNFYASPNVNSYSFSAPPATYTYNMQAPQQSAGSLADLLKLFGASQSQTQSQTQSEQKPTTPAPKFVSPAYYEKVMGSNSGGFPVTTSAPANVTAEYAQKFLGQPSLQSNAGQFNFDRSTGVNTGTAYRGGSQVGSGGNRI